MIRKLQFGGALALLAACLPLGAAAQSDGDTPLGDVARSLRKSKEAAVQPVIDNDNFSKMMAEAEAQRLKGQPVFSIDTPRQAFEMKSPDGTCSLSFSANATALLTSPYVPQDLPPSELPKLDGPATIENGTLQISVFNGTAWDLREITVGLTIVQDGANRGRYGTAKLLPAAETERTPEAKRADVTLLYHLKGVAAPSATAVFSEPLGGGPAPGQEWHWAIVQAQGLPPKPVRESAASSNQ